MMTDPEVAAGKRFLKEGVEISNESFIEQNKGAVNIYGNTGQGNLQQDHRLFWSFSWTGPINQSINQYDLFKDGHIQ